jgi:hypothetical protein
MGKKDVDLWGPMLAEFALRVAMLNATLPIIRRQVPRKTFDILSLKRKWCDFTSRYRSLKLAHKIRRYSPGETGLSAEEDGVVDTMNESIEKSNKEWPLFARFHASFGGMARFAQTFFQESTSPLKQAEKAGPPAAPHTASEAAGKESERENSLVRTLQSGTLVGACSQACKERAHDVTLDLAAANSDDSLFDPEDEAGTKKKFTKADGRRWSKRSIDIADTIVQKKADVASGVMDKKVAAMVSCTEMNIASRKEMMESMNAA